MTRVLEVIAKPEFYRWYGTKGYDACKNIMNTRATFGTRVHSEIAKHLLCKQIWADSTEMRITLEDFASWSSNHKLTPVHIEQTLYNDELGLAGTADFAGYISNVNEFDGKAYVLLDWKTSKAVFKNYHLQAAGYAYMYEKQYGVELDGCGIVAFRDGKIHQKYFTRDEYMKRLPVLKAAIALYNWKFNEGEWKK